MLCVCVCVGVFESSWRGEGEEEANGTRTFLPQAIQRLSIESTPSQCSSSVSSSSFSVPVSMAWAVSPIGAKKVWGLVVAGSGVIDIFFWGRGGGLCKKSIEVEKYLWLDWFYHLERISYTTVDCHSLLGPGAFLSVTVLDPRPHFEFRCPPGSGHHHDLSSKVK